MKLWALLFLVIGSIAGIVECGAAPSVPIVARAIEHHGGELYTKSETDMSMCSKSGCSRLRVRQNRGEFEIEVEGPVKAGARRVLMSNSELRVWLNGDELAVDESDRQGYKDWAMARVYFCFLPYRLADPSVILEDRGLVSWAGRSLHLVKVSFEVGTSTDADDQYLYWFDPKTGRLEMFAYSYDGGIRFRRAFDYRRVGGLLFFDQENLGIDEDGVSLEAVDERFVVEHMHRVSTVELREIRVRGLDESGE